MTIQRVPLEYDLRGPYKKDHNKLTLCSCPEEQVTSCRPPLVAENKISPSTVRLMRLKGGKVPRNVISARSHRSA